MAAIVVFPSVNFPAANQVLMWSTTEPDRAKIPTSEIVRYQCLTDTKSPDSSLDVFIFVQFYWFFF